VYDHEYTTNDGRKTDKVFFINWNPVSAATSLQMDYLTGRQAIREMCTGCFDVSASRTADILDGINGTVTAKSDDEEDEENDDWIDE